MFFLPKRKKWAKKKIVCSTPPIKIARAYSLDVLFKGK